jgi:hypothetical protein
MRVAAIVAAGVLVSGCGTTSRTACRGPDEKFSRPAVDVERALGRDGDLVAVEGVVVAPHGRPNRLCSSVDRSPSTVLCREPSLRLEGLRDLAAFESVRRVGETQIVESATIGGRIDGHTLRLMMSCRTLDVRDRFADETGEQLSLNTFSSNEDAEVLDVASVAALVPRDVRDRYGVFGIYVRTPRAHGPHELFDLSAGSFRWIREDDQWIAAKRYGDHLALAWLAGPTQRLDERWRRLDRVVRRLG